MTRPPAITERLAELQSWRAGLGTQIARVTEFLRAHDFLTANLSAALADARQSVERQDVTIAFVGETSRGKSELINGLFFPDLGRRLLPSGPGKTTRCVTELRFDRDVQTSVKLLPIETRESPKRFDELLADEGQWRSILFDADNADSTARALAALSETKRISLADAVAWGLHREGLAIPADATTTTTLVDVPRWRHAIVNFPHPLLDAGLVIIDTPGLATFTAEPELARQRVPNADAMILVLDAAQGVTKADLAIWKDHLGGARSFRDREKEEPRQARLVVLNKIDELAPPPEASPADAARETLREIDRRAHEAADLLRVDPMKVVAVSAKMGLAGKLSGDNDKIIKSRLYQLERALAASLPRNRQEGLGADILAALDNALESAQSALDMDRFETLDGLRSLTTLREKNEKLTASVVAQTHQKHDTLEAALRELKSIKNVHHTLGEALAAIVDVEAARKDAGRARRAVGAAVLPGKATEAVDQYFALVREKLDALEGKIDEIRNLYTSIRERMQRDFDIVIAEVHPFSTQRFHTELDKARSKAELELTKTSNLLVRRGGALAEQFDELVAARLVHVFEIAARESVTWMRGLYTSVERPLEDLRMQTFERSANVERFKSAELDLAGRIAEVQARLDVIKRKHAALAEARAGLARFSGRDGEEDAA